MLAAAMPASALVCRPLWGDLGPCVPWPVNRLGMSAKKKCSAARDSRCTSLAIRSCSNLRPRAGSRTAQTATGRACTRRQQGKAPAGVRPRSLAFRARAVAWLSKPEKYEEYKNFFQLSKAVFTTCLFMNHSCEMMKGAV